MPPQNSAAQPDLTSCNREPIHLLGQVQPWGFLLAANAGHVIGHASAYFSEHLGCRAEAVFGKALDRLRLGPALHEITNRLQALAG